MRARPLSAGWTPRRRLVSAGFLRTVAVAGLLVVAGLGSATTASAHSQLERTDPADGSQIDVLPDQITLTFNQNVLGLGDVLQVTGPGGSVADGGPTVVDNHVTQAILPGSPAGAYTVLWRVTSADGHPISGRFGFTAATGSSGTASTADPSAAGAGTASGAAGSTGQAPADDSNGSALIWLLVAAGALVVAAGIFLATRRPGPTLADDEVPAKDDETKDDGTTVDDEGVAGGRPQP
jgi:copper resistance protein C